MSLMDTWFTHAPLFESIAEKGLFVIGMVKQMKQHYRYNDKLLKLDDLFKQVRPALFHRPLITALSFRNDKQGNFST